MARFRGHIGVRREATETEPGIFSENIERIMVTGDIVIKRLRWQDAEVTQETVRANHALSIIAPESSITDLLEAVYVEWQNKKWVVQSIQYNRPRLELVLGRVYNGAG